jgi:hypothetical protein
MVVENGEVLWEAQGRGVGDGDGVAAEDARDADKPAPMGPKGRVDDWSGRPRIGSFPCFPVHHLQIDHWPHA